MSDRQNAAKAKKLGITEKELVALLAVRDKLARGVYKHVRDYLEDTRNWGMRPIFNMNCEMERCECGQVGCIGGWMAFEMGLEDPIAYVDSFDRTDDGGLGPLFYPPEDRDYNALTPRQAVNAIDKFLSGARYPWGIK